MTRGTIGVAIALLAAGLGGLAWQQHANAALRSELQRRRGLAAEQTRLQTEQYRLQAAQISPEELGERKEARAKLTALATEIELARRRKNAPLTATPGSGTAPPSAARPSLRDVTLDVSEWRNAGDRQPLDALETALWASAHGDVTTLADLLTISEESRARATGLFNTLPAALRGEVGTPEQLVAVLIANAMPLGSAGVDVQLDYPPGARLMVRMTDPDGKSREALISLHAREGHWRLVVPDAALAGYLKALQKPAGP